MIKYKILQKKKSCGMYGMYKLNSNIELFNGYTYEKYGEHLLFTAFLVYISNRFHRRFSFKKIEVAIHQRGNINVDLPYYKRDGLPYYEEDGLPTDVFRYDINLLILDDEKKILYILDDIEEKNIIERQIKINKILKR